MNQNIAILQCIDIFLHLYKTPTTFTVSVLLVAVLWYILTQRWLQHPSLLLTAAYGLDLRGVHQAPEVVLVVGPVQTQPQP